MTLQHKKVLHMIKGIASNAMSYAKWKHNWVLMMKNRNKDDSLIKNAVLKPLLREDTTEYELHLLNNPEERKIHLEQMHLYIKYCNEALVQFEAEEKFWDWLSKLIDLYPSPKILNESEV